MIFCWKDLNIKFYFWMFRRKINLKNVSFLHFLNILVIFFRFVRIKRLKCWVLCFMERQNCWLTTPEFEFFFFLFANWKLIQINRSYYFTLKTAVMRLVMLSHGTAMDRIVCQWLLEIALKEEQKQKMLKIHFNISIMQSTTIWIRKIVKIEII